MAERLWGLLFGAGGDVSRTNTCVGICEIGHCFK